MWFEILPSAAIIGVAIGLPHAAAYFINYVGVGNVS